MKEKGFKKCPWCGVFVERTEGCNFMTCLCTKEFCFKCGAIEIDDHKCINGCALFESDEPENRIRESFDRDLTQDEKDHLAKLRQTFIDRTQNDRVMVVKNFRNYPDNSMVREAMRRIFNKMFEMQNEEDKFFRQIVRGNMHDRLED